jgi:large subunit ribosomal protein L21
MAKEDYVIFKSGSKQYQVRKGDVIDVDLLDAEAGAEVVFDDVLFIADSNAPVVGAPTVPGCKVTCKVIENVSGPKITFVKYQPNHTQSRKHGHRQWYTRVEVVGISKAK